MATTHDETITELQRANLELRQERDAALAREAALAEVLSVINRSPGDPKPVFNAILEKAHRLCGADAGALMRYDGEHFHAVATHGLPGEFETLVRGPFRGPSHQKLIDGERIVHVADARVIPWDELGEVERAFVERTNLRTSLFVSLRKDGNLLGFISADRHEVRPFSDKEIALLESFADQAVIAIENARLLTEQQEALEQQTATAEVLQVINASPGNLAPVFEAMLEKAMRLCEAAFGTLWTYGACVHAVALHNVPPIFAEFLTRAPHRVGPDSAHGRLLSGEAVVHIPDIVAEQAYQLGDPIRRALVEIGGGRALLAVPLRRDDTFVGDFVIYRQEVGPFSDRQIALLQNFAAQAVIAMENARLLDEIRQRQEELRITFENMGDGVAMFDETPRLVAWNRKFQEIFSVSDQLLEEHRTYAEYIRYLAERGDYGEGAGSDEQVRRLTANVGEHHAYERTRPNGRVIEVQQNPIPGGGFVLIYADITERKRSEAEIRAARDAAESAFRDLKAAQANLIQAEKMASLGQLTAGIAHEIKIPLNFVNNFASLSVELLDELKETAAPGFAALDDDRRRDIEDISATLTTNLEKIVEHGQRADGIVRGMLEHARGTSGERRTVDLNTLVEEALNLAYHGARAQDQSFNVTLRRDFGTGIAPIELTPQDVTRVLVNLFSNGFYATRKREKIASEPGFEPTLKVVTRDHGDAVEIRVWDNGTGIPADMRDKLFQPFFTTKPTGEGTGLGLSISYDVVTQQHGGTIMVESEEGEYAEFIVTIPRVTTAEPQGTDV